ncbi:MAG: hypothetical protein JSS10_03655 [Verrucomicrobia bacterium]|nr:hypothetical protein [Verrucomicrobiota bacterium]
MAILLSKIPFFGYYFLSPDQQTEYNVHRYTLLFQKALEEGRSLPDESKQVERLANAMGSPSHTPAAVQACEELHWMSEVSKSSNYVRAEKVQGSYRLKILPEALKLPYNQFCLMILPLVNGKNYRVLIGDKEYTSRAVAYGLGHKMLESLQNFTEASHCHFRDEKKQKWTVAQIRSVGLKSDVDLSDVEESLFAFSYETFVDGRHLDPAWWNQHTHDELFRLQSFVKKFMTESKLEIPEFDKGLNVVRVAEDRLLLTPEQFQQEMRAFLEFYKTATVIQIEQSNSSYPLVFRRDKFKQLVDAKVDPQSLKSTYKVKTSEGEETVITSDVFYQVLIFLSERRGPDWLEEKPFEIEYPKETLDQAIQYVKTDCMPLLTWEGQKRLVDFLKECAPGTSWEKGIQNDFIQRDPYLSVDELEFYQWADLATFLEPYKANNVRLIHLGPYVYTFETLMQLIHKDPPISVSLLAKRAWFLINGERIYGSLSVLQFWPNLFNEYPKKGTGEAHNPIRFQNETTLLKNPLPSKSFSMLQALKAFMQVIGQSGDLKGPLSDLESKLQHSYKIYIGDRNKPPRHYWRHVYEELAKYPQAQEIVLDGCTTTWRREKVSLFCQLGTLTLEDLNTPLLLTLGTDDALYGRFDPAYWQIWQAEWKCLSLEDPTIDRSGRTNPQDRIPCKHFRVIYEMVFELKKHDDPLKEIRPSLKMLSPLALQKIVPKPAVQPRVFLTEPPSFYAQRILAIFWASLGSYLIWFNKYWRSSPYEHPGIAMGSFYFSAFYLDPKGRKFINKNLMVNDSLPFVLKWAFFTFIGAGAGLQLSFMLKDMGFRLDDLGFRGLIDRTVSVISAHFPFATSQNGK